MCPVLMLQVGRRGWNLHPGACEEAETPTGGASHTGAYTALSKYEGSDSVVLNINITKAGGTIHKVVDFYKIKTYFQCLLLI